MHRIPLDLRSVHAARELKAGIDRTSVSNAHGISVRHIEKIEHAFADVSDTLLAGIERVLADREKLRHLIASLLHRDEFSS
jgi:hypothetical protein